MKRVAFVVWEEDVEDWASTIKSLKFDGWRVDIFTVVGAQYGIMPIGYDTNVPKEVADADVVMVFGMGDYNWFVGKLNQLNKPTLYLYSIGIPGRLDVDEYELLGVPASIDDIEKALERLSQS